MNKIEATSLTVNGIEYVPKNQQAPLPNTNVKIVRTRIAGVFYGEIESRDGQTIVMKNARRIWYWEGAASLSQLATQGTTKPGKCKFPIAVPRVELFEACEILDVSAQALASLNSVEVWKQ